MNKLNNMWFGALFTLSLLFVGWCFQNAALERGEAKIGGEVFTIALPLMLVWLKSRATEQKLKKQIRAMKHLSGFAKWLLNRNVELKKTIEELRHSV